MLAIKSQLTVCHVIDCITYTVLNLILHMEKNSILKNACFSAIAPYINIIRIRKMLIYCVMLDHALYLINYSIVPRLPSGILCWQKMAEMCSRECSTLLVTWQTCDLTLRWGPSPRTAARNTDWMAAFLATRNLAKACRGEHPSRSIMAHRDWTIGPSSSSEHWRWQLQHYVWDFGLGGRGVHMDDDFLIWRPLPIPFHWLCDSSVNTWTRTGIQVYTCIYTYSIIQLVHA